MNAKKEWTPSRVWTPTTKGTTKWWKYQEQKVCQQQLEYSKSRKAKNSLNCKTAGTPATSECQKLTAWMLNTVGTLAKTGTPATKGRSTMMESQGTEGMSTTTGPQQKQKGKKQLECWKQQGHQQQKGRQQWWKKTRSRRDANNGRTSATAECQKLTAWMLNSEGTLAKTGTPTTKGGQQQWWNHQDVNNSRTPVKEKTPTKTGMLKTAWMQATEGMPTIMKKQQRGCQQQ
jgi:hypothetical protein